MRGIINREKLSIYYLLITATDNDVPPRLGQAYVSAKKLFPPVFDILFELANMNGTSLIRKNHLSKDSLLLKAILDDELLKERQMITANDLRYLELAITGRIFL